MEKIICIGRNSGSGGNEVAKKVAERLQIPFYDKMRLKEEARKRGIQEADFDKYDEKYKNWWTAAMESGSSAADLADEGYYYREDVRFYEIMRNIIERLAFEGPCVFLGRGAAAILANQRPVISVFIRADDEYRVKRIMKKKGMKLEEAGEFIRKTDHNRERYHNFFDNKPWGRMESYDMVLSSSALGIDRTADAIIAAYGKDSQR